MGQALPSGWWPVENCHAVYKGLDSFSNDVEEMMDTSLTKCSGDKKMWGALTLLKDRSPIQRYPGKLEEGAKKNLVNCNRDKY